MNKLTLLFILLLSSAANSQLLDLIPAERLNYQDYLLFEEIAPIYNSQTKQLYFVRLKTSEKATKNWNQDIYVSELDIENKELRKIRSIDNLNTAKNNGVCGTNVSGTKIYLLDNYSKKIGLAYSEQENGEFKKPIPLEIPNLEITTPNYGFYAHPDETTILLSYSNMETYGKEDLYIIEKINDQWTSPKNLGDKINSSGFEISPFLTKNKDTLFFASNGQKSSYGGSDIYFSVKDKDGNWLEPQNAGPEINSPFFDAYLIQINNNYIWTSTRENKNANLYITSKKKNIPLIAEFSKKDVSIFNGSDGEIHLDSISGYPPYKFSWSNGMFTSDCYQLREGTYQVKITDNKGQKLEKEITIQQPKLKVNDVIRIPEIMYKSDSWEFVNNSEISSIDSLNFIAQILKNNPNLVIRLISHTDSRGDEKRNLILSENRSRACFKYLVEKQGIDARRIIPVGMGEKQPSKILDKNSGKEIVLTEEYINQFKKDSELIDRYNQLNRRTEGKVERLNFSANDTEAPQIYFEYLSFD
ncbi:MAG: OmpA family protein [Bacteroidota bacterium]